MEGEFIPRFAMGWERDLPDFRDMSQDTDAVRDILDRSKPLRAVKKKLPAKVDLRQWCSPIEDQGRIGSCTAHSGIGLLEYFQRRAYGRHLDGSRLFLYKVTRNLLGWKGDQGAYLRSAMKAMVLFGVPPEQYYPYHVKKYDQEPPAFCYAFAANYKSYKYYRLDPSGTSTTTLLARVRQNLAAELPSMFGFSVYSSIPEIGDGRADIPFPKRGDRQEGGHAIMAVGYDNARNIGGKKGALLIRNSWSTAWGDDGYGWLPYEYVEAGLAVDFWTLVDAGFVDTELFE